MKLREVWSGGQTGVDRAALDVAQALSIPIGGWVPRGRLAEDGVIPPAYQGLRETPTADYAQRTSRLGKPHFAVDLDQPRGAGLSQARAWLARIDGSRLNVAGPRESAEPGIHAEARAWLLALLAADSPVSPARHSVAPPPAL